LVTLENLIRNYFQISALLWGQQLSKITCEEAIYITGATAVGCGSTIVFGPVFDDQGIQLTAPIDLENDSEIILFLNEGYEDGNCAGQSGETQTKMVLTKM